MWDWNLSMSAPIGPHYIEATNGHLSKLIPMLSWSFEMFSYRGRSLWTDIWTFISLWTCERNRRNRAPAGGSTRCSEVISFNSLISAYEKGQQWQWGLFLFWRMHQDQHGLPGISRAQDGFWTLTCILCGEWNVYMSTFDGMDDQGIFANFRYISFLDYQSFCINLPWPFVISNMFRGDSNLFQLQDRPNRPLIFLE